MSPLQTQQLTIGNLIVNYQQKTEVFDLKREIFTRHLYYFDTEEANPIIIDAGAHLGLATLYFKNLYPTAQIIAFEPNPILFKLLEENIAINHLKNVTAHQVALDKHVGHKDFFVDATQWGWHSSGSFTAGAWDNSQKNQASFKVQTDRLGNYLANLPRVDLLKLDIEGVEMSVLLSIRDQLDKIQAITIEFHPNAGQRLDQLQAFLTKRGFEVTLYDRDNKRKRSWHPKELLIVKAVR
jgi:FkbM family methyltransferase